MNIKPTEYMKKCGGLWSCKKNKTTTNSRLLLHVISVHFLYGAKTRKEPKEEDELATFFKI